MTLFSLKDINFKDIVRYPNITISKGNVTFICGKSGCGKSTMLKLLNGVVSSKSGSLQYLGKEITEYDSIALRREVLLCGQSFYLLDSSIRENIKEFYAYRDLPAPDDETIQSYLAVCSLSLPLDTLCTTMSGGERQRVYLAICLSLLPNVMLLDEPTSALDEHTSMLFFENIKTFCQEKGITLIVVSHSKSLATQFADEIIQLEAR